MKVFFPGRFPRAFRPRSRLPSVNFGRRFLRFSHQNPNLILACLRFSWCTTVVDSSKDFVPQTWGCRNGVVVRALASHRCGLGSIPGPGVTCGLRLLLVLVPAPRVFFPVLRFSSIPQNHNSKFQFDLEMRATGLSALFKLYMKTSNWKNDFKLLYSTCGNACAFIMLTKFIAFICDKCTHV